MVEKYLKRNGWIKDGKCWAHKNVAYPCHRHVAIRVQLFRDKGICYTFKRLMATIV